MSRDVGSIFEEPQPPPTPRCHAQKFYVMGPWVLFLGMSRSAKNFDRLEPPPRLDPTSRDMGLKNVRSQSKFKYKIYIILI